MQTIRNKASGAEQNVESMNGLTASEWEVVGIIPTAASGDLSLYRGGAEQADRVEAMLLAQVKAEAERRKMLFLSPGGAKKAEYPKKQAEVAFFDSLGGTVANALVALNLMSPDAQLTKFPYALASARLRKEPTIVPAIGRFRAGMRKALTVEDVAAVEELACETIKAGTTAAAKRAAFAAIAWP